jgi:adenosine deaminase
MIEDGLAELHTHLGASVASEIMWSLAHEQGIALPVKDYWEFDRLVTIADPRRVDSLDALNDIYHWTELIQSSPLAVERSVHAAIGGAFRSQHITTLELRFNPMKRNRGGERDLDHIIMAATRGLDRAEPRVPDRPRRPDPDDGPDLRRAAERDHRREGDPLRAAGVVGVDIAGPRPGGERYPYRDLSPLVEEARSAGLGVTIHVGEEGEEHGDAEIGEVVEHLRPDRIGHGILAARNPELMAALREQEIVPRDLPHVEPAHARAPERGGGARHLPCLRRERRRLHDRDGRARDDADAPARRVRAPAADRRARRGRARRGQPPRPRGELRPGCLPRSHVAPSRRYPGGCTPEVTPSGQ